VASLRLRRRLSLPPHHSTLVTRGSSARGGRGIRARNAASCSCSGAAPAGGLGARRGMSARGRRATAGRTPWAGPGRRCRRRCATGSPRGSPSGSPRRRRPPTEPGCHRDETMRSHASSAEASTRSIQTRVAAPTDRPRLRGVNHAHDPMASSTASASGELSWVQMSIWARPVRSLGARRKAPAPPAGGPPWRTTCCPSTASRARSASR
jgi:hypothetical protein